MKKILCLIFSLVLLVSFPFSVSAVVVSPDQMQVDSEWTKEEIQLIALEAFPEYAGRIVAVPTRSECSAMSVVEDDAVIISETRDISPNLSVNYTEFTSGINTIIVLDKDYEVVNTSSNGTLTRKTIDFTVSTNVSSLVARWKDFECVHAFNDYDNITSVGYNPYPNSASIKMFVNQSKLAENSAGSAYVTYNGYMYLLYNNEQDSAAVQFTLRASVGNDSFSLSVTRTA